MGKTVEDRNKEIMQQVEANDAASIYLLVDCCYKGLNGVQQDQTKVMELYVRAADLSHSKAHCHLGDIYHHGGDSKKDKFRTKAADNLGCMEYKSGKVEQAVSTGASAWHSMHSLITLFKKGNVSRDEINTTLTAYKNSCAEMRSEARDDFIQFTIKHYGGR